MASLKARQTPLSTAWHMMERYTKRSGAMSKINGDKKRDHLRARKQTKMREKMRELRAAMNAKPKAAK